MLRAVLAWLDWASRTGMTWWMGTIRVGLWHVMDGWSLLPGLLWRPSPAGTGFSRPVGRNGRAEPRFTPSDALGSGG